MNLNLLNRRVFFWGGHICYINRLLVCWQCLVLRKKWNWSHLMEIFLFKRNAYQRFYKNLYYKLYLDEYPYHVCLTFPHWELIYYFCLHCFLNYNPSKLCVLFAGLRRCWLYPLQRGKASPLKKRSVLDMTQNWIWWWSSSSGALGVWCTPLLLFSGPLWL